MDYIDKKVFREKVVAPNELNKEFCCGKKVYPVIKIWVYKKD